MVEESLIIISGLTPNTRQTEDSSPAGVLDQPPVSIRWILDFDTPDLAARSRCDQPLISRATISCAVVLCDVELVGTGAKLIPAMF